MMGVEQRQQRVFRLPSDPPSISGEAKHDRWGEYITRGPDMARQTRVRRKIVRFALDQQRKPLCIVHEIPRRDQTENNGRNQDLLISRKLDKQPQDSAESKQKLGEMKMLMS